ncbi:cupredoxin domain-containing protein [Geodermatophilus sp. SYSU D00758]
MTGRLTGRRGGAAVAGVLLGAGLVLAGCGADAPATPGTAASTTAPGAGTVTTAPDGVQEVTLQTQDDYVFTPDTFTVAPGRVRLTVTNVAEQMVHNFRFTPGTGPAPIDEEIPLLAAGESRTIEFEVTAPGDYPFECTFHIQLDQVGTMTVTG